MTWFEQRNTPLSGHNVTFDAHSVAFAEDGYEPFVEYEEIFVDPPGTCASGSGRPTPRGPSL